MQSSAPDDGRKHYPKHVELTLNNKLIYIMLLIGYFYNYIFHFFKLVESIFLS
jgi:hypothetical protein